MSKTVIISGGMLDEGFTEKVLEANPEAYIIAVDKGLEYCLLYTSDAADEL